MAWAVLGVLALLLSGCVDDQVVFRDRPLFEDPPPEAGQFLGMTDLAQKRTVCGNCHIGRQREWEQTAHAGAWRTLQESGAAQASCEGCHSVSSRGNVAEGDSLGWVGSKNPRYQNVQCESCHGPGLPHVLNPDASGTKPLASVAAGTDLTRGCGECHSGDHHPFADEWSASRHARFDEHRAENPSCVSCHESRSVLEAWGVKSTFLEQGDPDEHLAVTCAVCHDPHDARNPGQLRFPIDQPDVERNLCMKCHLRNAEPTLTSSRGPHSPQGPLLLGDAGWFPPNFEYPEGALVGSHASDRNPRLCAGCHVNAYEIRDELTGAFVFRSTGHSFKAIPCVNAQGVPDNAADCALTERSFRACTTCHGSEDAARFALERARTRIARLVGELQPLLAQVPATEFSTTDTRITTGEGAKFNLDLATQPGSAIHNPFLVEALLIASIRQVGIDYGIQASGAVSLVPELMRSE